MTTARPTAPTHSAFLAAAAKGPGADIWMLVASNVVALLTALLQGWQLVDLLLVYWTQSLIIGFSYVGRILSLRRFRSGELQSRDLHVAQSLATRTAVALFFCVHYGFFHWGYLAFLQEIVGDVRFDTDLLLVSLVFACNHLFSFLYHRRRDRAGTPHIVAMMLTPYARILPMHLTAVFGIMAMVSVLGLVLFAILKTAADTLMHVLEHGAVARFLRDPPADDQQLKRP